MPTRASEPVRRRSGGARPAAPGRGRRRASNERRCGRALEVLPLGFDERGLVVEVPDVGKKRVRYDRIQAIASACTETAGGATLVLVDLVLNWRDGPGADLKLVRLRSDRLDPARFGSPDALVAFVHQLLARSGAVPIPRPPSARGRPFAFYRDLRRYEVEVLGVARVTKES